MGSGTWIFLNVITIKKASTDKIGASIGSAKTKTPLLVETPGFGNNLRVNRTDCCAQTPSTGVCADDVGAPGCPQILPQKWQKFLEQSQLTGYRGPKFRGPGRKSGHEAID